MASSVVLSVDHIQCSICLDVFTDPVSTPCGHNFCKPCIMRYWDSPGLCNCPMCQETFKIRPELKINTFIAEMVSQIKKSAPVGDVSSSLERPVGGTTEVPCDFCPGEKLKALKSCLVCLASYCETHLEPHKRLAAWKTHKLIDPVDNLWDRVCQKHDRPLELFCSTDQTCVCRFCIEGEHKIHCTVPLEEEVGRRKADVRKMKDNILEMIRERQQKIKEVKQSADLRRKEADRETVDSAKTFTALVSSIQSNQAEISELIKEQQRVTEKQAEVLIGDLEQEVADLRKRNTELDQLSNTEDHFHFLRRYPALSPPPPAKDWSQISVGGEMAVESVMRALVQLEKSLHEEMEKLKELKFERIQQLFAVDVTLDPNTAFPELVLSEDGKNVKWENIFRKVPNNPERFNYQTCVLAKQGFSSGRFYYEVQVKWKTTWILGVVRASINRKGPLVRSPENGHWSFGLWRGVGYKAHAGPDVVIRLKQKPEKVGVFVDYEKGEVSFYDVDTKSLLYSFTGCRFNDKLYPCFSPGHNSDGMNPAPLVICPVIHSGLTL